MVRSNEWKQFEPRLYFQGYFILGQIRRPTPETHQGGHKLEIIFSPYY